MTRRNTNNATTLARQVQAWLNALDSTGSVLRGEFDEHVNNRNPHGKNFWRGRWTQQTYYQFDQVIDDLWLCIANKTTTDKAAPQALDAPVWGLPDTPTWTVAAHTGTVFSGTIITPPDDRMYAITGIRVWIQDTTADAKYRLIVRDNVRGIVQAGQEFSGDIVATPQWVSILFAPELIFENDNISFLLQQWNSSADTNFNFPYVRGANDQADNFPGIGNWNQDNQGTSFRIDNNDDNGVNRQTELDQIISGTRIRVVSLSDPNSWTEFTVITVAYEPVLGWYNMNVLPVAFGPSGGTSVGDTCDVQLSIPVPTPTNWVRLPDFDLQYPNSQGYISFDDIDGGTINEDAHGIDIQYQAYLPSDDWDIQALSSTKLPAIGTPETFGPGAKIINSTSNNFWSRWLPVEKENLAKLATNTTVPPGPPPSWEETFNIQQFIGYTASRFISVNDPYVISTVNWLETQGYIAAGRSAIILAP